MSLRFAWSFLTRLRGGADPRTDRDLGRSVPWFPVVGAVVGMLSGGAFWALWTPLGAPLAAIAAVATGIVITGAFHEDGWADTADALGGTTRRQRLEIMKDSRLGTFGVLALLLSTLVQVHAVMSLAPRDGVIALALAHGLGRTAAVVVLLAAPATRSSGLGIGYAAHLQPARCISAVAIAAAAAVSLGLPAAVAAASAGLGALLVAGFARRTLDGATGDVCGSAAHLGQVVALVGMSRLVDDFGWTWT